jgi:hypothetical protein
MGSTRPWTGVDGNPNLRMVQVDADRLDVALAYIDEQQQRIDATKEWNVFEPSIGDVVQVNELLRDSHLATEKLRPHWTGPYKVVEVRRRSPKVHSLSGVPREGWISWYRLRRWKGIHGSRGAVGED